MKNLLVLGHPKPNSFQHSFFTETADSLKRSGDYIFLADLYSDEFNPVLPREEIERGSSTEELILKYQKELRNCDRLLLFYPDWWGMPPAILKGWLDRVLASGIAYSWQGEDFLDKKWIPLLTKKEIVIYISSDDSLDSNWLKRLWKDKIFSKCGAKVTINYIDKVRYKSFSEISEWIQNQKQKLLNN